MLYCTAVDEGAEPTAHAATAHAECCPHAMQAFAAKLGTVPTTVLRLDNMVKAVSLLDAQEYSEVRTPCSTAFNAASSEPCVES